MKKPIEFLWLYGSNTSPYVRRFRLLLENQDYNYVCLDLTNSADRETLSTVSPIMKIPVIKHRQQIIWDSRQIFEYFVELGLHPKLTWEEQNILTAIDAAQDTLILEMMLNRADVVLPAQSQMAKGNAERLPKIFLHLESLAKQDRFSDWNYLSFSLYSLLDWANFRNRFDFSEHKGLISHLESQKGRSIVMSTDPRL